MNNILESRQSEFENAITRFKSELGAVRTGRATPALVENIQASAYGVKSPLLQLAGISAPDSRNIIIEPWDKNIVKDIEKAINESNLGLSAVNEGKHLRVSLPALTEESRKNLLKILNQKAEAGRQRLRAIRDEIKNEIQQAEKNKEMGEDEKFRLIKKLDEITADYNNKIKEIADKKEKEIMTV